MSHSPLKLWKISIFWKGEWRTSNAGKISLTPQNSCADAYHHTYVSCRSYVILIIYNLSIFIKLCTHESLFWYLIFKHIWTTITDETVNLTCPCIKLSFLPGESGSVTNGCCYQVFFFLIFYFFFLYYN